jgi:hypothetical protein
MTATLTSDPHQAPTGDTGAAPGAATPAPQDRSRPTWPLFGLAGAISGFLSVTVSISSGVTEEDSERGIRVIDDLTRGGYHAGFLLGLVSVGCLLVAAQGWRRWAQHVAPDSLGARMVSQGLAATATVNIIFTGIMGSMAIYLPGGSDEGWLADEAIFTNFTLLDFGSLLGWWGAAMAAMATVGLAFGRSRLLPRWMGVVSIVTLLPALLFAGITGLPGFVGFTMPIWLAVISVGMVFSRRAAR